VALARGPFRDSARITTPRACNSLLALTQAYVYTALYRVRDKKREAIKVLINDTFSGV